MIKEGQLRRWLHPEGIRGDGSSVFIVTRRNVDLFYAQGSRIGEPMLTHWEIVCGGEIIPGWVERTLETESVLVSE